MALILTYYSEGRTGVFFPGGYSQKVGWGGAAHFPKPLPYLWLKSGIFATLFMTWPKTFETLFTTLAAG